MKSRDNKNMEEEEEDRCRRPIIGLQCFNYLSQKHGIVFVSFLLLLFSATNVAAQQGTSGPSEPQGPYARFSPAMAVIIVIVISALFFMGFFSIYIRHCGGRDSSSNIRQALSLRTRRAAAAAARGLDAEVIETFPIFQYSEVKAQKVGKGALECAVCLNEFEDDEMLRLIPKCDHVFHTECIDAWLESHVTCPVCRANLVPQPGESAHFHETPESQLAEPNCRELDTQQNHDVSIRVEDDVGANNVEAPSLPPRPPHKDAVLRNFSFNQNRPPRSRSVRTPIFGKYRSHSTGHSLVQQGENMERFTLRLPEEVRKQMMNRAMMKRTESLVALPRQASSRRGYRTGEGNSREKPYGRLDWLEVKSERWVFSAAPPFLSRASSLRSPKVLEDNGDGSVSSRTPKGMMTAVKMPLSCLEPKSSEETGLITSQPAPPPV